jgi:hypothetical protein
MDEQVASPIIWRDEAETLVVTEPLDGSRCHALTFDPTFRTLGLGRPDGPEQTRET